MQGLFKKNFAIMSPTAEADMLSLLHKIEEFLRRLRFLQKNFPNDWNLMIGVNMHMKKILADRKEINQCLVSLYEDIDIDDVMISLFECN